MDRGINKEIFGMGIRDSIASIVAGIYDPESGTAKMINAGHEPPYIIGRKKSFFSKML